MCPNKIFQTRFFIIEWIICIHTYLAKTDVLSHVAKKGLLIFVSEAYPKKTFEKFLKICVVLDLIFVFRFKIYWLVHSKFLWEKLGRIQVIFYHIDPFSASVIYWYLIEEISINPEFFLQKIFYIFTSLIISFFAFSNYELISQAWFWLKKTP